MTRARAYALVAAVCALPRLGVLLHERGAILANFTEKSDTFAWTFVHTGTFGFVPGEPSAWTQPLYGWFLVPVYWLFGRNWEAVGLAQIALAWITALLVLELGRRLLTLRWGTVAAVLATLNPYLVWHDVHVNREIVDQVLAAAVVLVTLVLAERPSLRFAALDGVLLGLAMLGNTRLFALPVVVVAWLAWRVRPARLVLVTGAVLLACAGVAVAPWLIRNEVVVGCVALTTDGRALWKANNPATHGVLARGGWIDDVPRDLPRGRPRTPEEAAFFWEPIHGHRKVHVDECSQPPYYEHRVFSFWVHHPGEKGRLMAQAARMLWSPQVTETAGRSGAGTGVDVGRHWIAPAYTIVLYVLGAVGLFFVPRAVAALFLLLLAYNTVAALAFAGATRYRVSWDFLLAVLAAATLERVWRRRRPA